MKKRNNMITDLLNLYYEGDIESFLNKIDQSIINEIDRDGRTLLHNMVILNDVGMVDKMIQLGSNINIGDKNGWTSLHFSVQEFNPEMVKILISKGADVNALDINGNSVLSRAVYNSKGNSEVLKLLLSAGANPDIENKSGVSARKLAFMISNFDVTECFR